MSTPIASGQNASSVADALDNGSVGSLRIGMAPSEVESLLQRQLAEAIDDQAPVVMVNFSDLHDLESLGINRIFGLNAEGADLVFVTPAGGDRRLHSASISVACDDIPELVHQLGGWESINPAPVYIWAIMRKPQCHLSLWKPSDAFK